jgi:fructose-specific component phosphotransferase system IIB-like protein
MVDVLGVGATTDGAGMSLRGEHLVVVLESQAVPEPEVVLASASGPASRLLTLCVVTGLAVRRDTRLRPAIARELVD